MTETAEQPRALCLWRAPLLSLCGFLTVAEPAQPSELVIVLAGRPERKAYGLQLLQGGLTGRLILSVGRFEVRPYAQSGWPGATELTDLARRTPAEQRHFFMNFARGSHDCDAVVASLRRVGTSGELAALAHYLRFDLVKSISIVSTSIHLRRIRFCCRRIPFFSERETRYLAVPEDLSSFRHQGWWRHWGHWSYVTLEYAKLAGYFLAYRN